VGAKAIFQTPVVHIPQREKQESKENFFEV